MLVIFLGRLSEGTQHPAVLQDSGTFMAVPQWCHPGLRLPPKGWAGGVDGAGGCTGAALAPSSASGAAAARHGGNESWSGRRIALALAIALGITRELMPNWWVMPTHSGNASVLPAPRGQIWGAGGWGAEMPQRRRFLGRSEFLCQTSGSWTVPSRSLPVHRW